MVVSKELLWHSPLCCPATQKTKKVTPKQSILPALTIAPRTWNQIQFLSSMSWTIDAKVLTKTPSRYLMCVQHERLFAGGRQYNKHSSKHQLLVSKSFQKAISQLNASQTSLFEGIVHECSTLCLVQQCINRSLHSRTSEAPYGWFLLICLPLSCPPSFVSATPRHLTH
jgi:hypothetical protein